MASHQLLGVDQNEWTTYDNPPSIRFSFVPPLLVDAAEVPISDKSPLAQGSPPSSALLSLVDRRTRRELTVFVGIKLE